MAADGVKIYAIHPALGIARLGNAPADAGDPTSFYLGSEAPMETPNQGKPYKSGGKIKKQAQRFRIYEFTDGQATREITLQQPDIAAITWTVHLANRKAALNTDQPPGSVSCPSVVPPACYVPAGTPPVQSENPDANPHYWPAGTRNAQVPAASRSQLCIDAGAQTVGGSIGSLALNGSVTLFPDNAPPVSKLVGLGQLVAEAQTGRLLVFGADGTSESVLNGQFSTSPKITDFGNNDNWYDDTADGWVQATISFRDGTTVTLDQPSQRAWVITAAPRYSTGMACFTTLYDAAVSAVHDFTSAPPRASFARDVYPIIASSGMLQWLSVRGASGHGGGTSGYFLSADRLRLMADNNPASTSDAYKARNAMFQRMRNPNVAPDRASVQRFMPQVSDDVIDPAKLTHTYDIASVTAYQYLMLQQWAAGQFDADGVPAFAALDTLPVAQQPAALDRAALEGTAGTPFYPGIESWRIMRPADLYVPGQPLRMTAATQPGDLTMGNALPWQADFLDCNDIWWPIQRPNEVTRNGQALQSWVPDAWIADEDAADYNAMVNGWWGLGFVTTSDNGATYQEVERSLNEPQP